MVSRAWLPPHSALAVATHRTQMTLLGQRSGIVPRLRLWSTAASVSDRSTSINTHETLLRLQHRGGTQLNSWLVSSA